MWIEAIKKAGEWWRASKKMQKVILDWKSQLLAAVSLTHHAELQTQSGQNRSSVSLQKSPCFGKNDAKENHAVHEGTSVGSLSDQ